jgi:hypothetical protein
MRRMMTPILYVLIWVVSYVLFRFLILPGDANPYQWMATVIALGCVGAVFTIRRSMREDA